MTRKKGVALIICLTLIISMALPGTLAFSGDPSAENENLTLAEDTPVPTPENSVEEKAASATQSPAEGGPHGEGCPFYTSVMGSCCRRLREPTALSQSLRRDRSTLKSTSFA